MDFYQSMSTQDVRGSIAIRFSIDEREGILEAKHIAEALHIPFQPKDPKQDTCQLRKELPSEMLLVDALLRSNIFPLQHSMWRRGPILDALYRIYMGFYFGPHHLIMDALLYFEEKVHRKKVQRADAIPLLFPRLLCHLVERNSTKVAPPVPVPPVPEQPDQAHQDKHPIKSIPSTPTAPSMPQAASTDPLATPPVPPVQDQHSIILDQHTTILRQIQQDLGFVPLQTDIPGPSEPRVPAEETIPPMETITIDVPPQATHETPRAIMSTKGPRYLIIGHLFILLY
ncbi:hypothetical protein CK203_042065 [Vitis vinifera]|uniref:Uncharacterized protein n=1 Tax=Vitis vinifera TaxID=29760 RepID=A0A438HHJ7_VITVI|nr:hypothetical protein CK203_042065 [Vitis vinifera]